MEMSPAMPSDGLDGSNASATNWSSPIQRSMTIVETKRKSVEQLNGITDAATIAHDDNESQTNFEPHYSHSNVSSTLKSKFEFERNVARDLYTDDCEHISSINLDEDFAQPIPRSATISLPVRPSDLARVVNAHRIDVQPSIQLSTSVASQLSSVNHIQGSVTSTSDYSSGYHSSMSTYCDADEDSSGPIHRSATISLPTQGRELARKAIEHYRQVQRFTATNRHELSVGAVQSSGSVVSTTSDYSGDGCRSTMSTYEENLTDLNSPSASICGHPCEIEQLATFKLSSPTASSKSDQIQPIAPDKAVGSSGRAKCDKSKRKQASRSSSYPLPPITTRFLPRSLSLSKRNLRHLCPENFANFIERKVVSMLRGYDPLTHPEREIKTVEATSGDVIEDIEAVVSHELEQINDNQSIGNEDGFNDAASCCSTVSMRSSSVIDANEQNRLSDKNKNPWGKESYADIIEMAIISSPSNRLKLSEIYQYFIKNFQYFGNRADPKQSSGWKNSIRHNLSLHNRFMRIQNEGAGKSSWWVINPDAKPGRNPRRQRSATLETSSKVALDKKRRGARKKVLEMRAGGLGIHSAGSSQASVLSHELYGDGDDSLGSFEPTFRQRTQSNLSVTNTMGRPSPTDFNNFDFPPFVEASVPRDILDRTNEISINHGESPAFHRPMANPMLSEASSSTLSMKAKQAMGMGHVKEENGVQPPPSYHELNAVRGVTQLQNPLLRTHFHNRIPSPTELCYNGMMYHTVDSGPSWGSMPNGGSPLSMSSHGGGLTLGNCMMRTSAANNMFVMSGSNASLTNALPMDLENLTLPEQPLIELDSMEALLRHELSQSTSNQLSFDNI